MNTYRLPPGFARARFLATVPACVACAACFLGRAQAAEVPAPADNDVIFADRAFASRASDAGIRAAYDRYLADDAVLFRPLPVPARAWLETHEPATGQLEWTPAMAETACDSSFGVTYGTWTYTARDSMTADTGHYLTAWRRFDAGDWRIVLDQSLSLASLPAPTPPSSADDCKATTGGEKKLAAAERKLNKGLRNLQAGDAAALPVRAVTVGSLPGSGLADLAVTHGELLDQQASPGDSSAVRAVYVRVWQRHGRAWRVLHDYVTPVAP